jgi:hypothetical protein
VTAISDLTSPETAILDMSGFLLRIWSDAKVPAGCCEHRPGPPRLAGDAHEGHLLPVRMGG